MSVLKTIKKTLTPRKPISLIGLSDFIVSHDKFGYWLRPNSPTQSQQMVAAYLKAMKDDLPNGGYIFVNKTRAPDLFRQLTELNATYQAIHLEDMADIQKIICLEDPKALWVIVEDDSLPYETLASRFKVAEVALRSNMAPPLTTRILLDKLTEHANKRAGSKTVLLMFIEMDYPSVKGFSVVLSQSRSLRIASCRVSLETTHYRELNKIISGSPEHSEEEIYSRAANTLCVYGSGLNNFTEMNDRVAQWKIYKQEEDFKRSDFTFTDTSIETGLFRNESNNCLAFGFDIAQAVDISK